MRSLPARLSFALLLFVPAHAMAQNDPAPPPMPLDKQEQIEQGEKANAVLNAYDAKMLAGVTVKKNECMKAFGNTEFCECIGEKSPVGVSFVDYVSIVVGTKESFHYDQLSPEGKKVFDATRAARDACVNWKGKDSERAKTEGAEPNR